MPDFIQELRNWQLFYSTVALASVTLAGLLFVSLSMHRENLKTRKDTLQLRLARGSFGDFLYVLMLGLIFLVPFQAPVGLVVALFVLGLARGLGLIRLMARSRHSRVEKRSISHGMREIGLPLLASLGLMAVSIAIWFGNMTAIFGLVVVVAALLASASWNAWLILVD